LAPPPPKEDVRSAPQRGALRDDLRLLVTKDGLMFVSDWNAGLHAMKWTG
jgi:hypothetical protein